MRDAMLYAKLVDGQTVVAAADTLLEFETFGSIVRAQKLRLFTAFCEPDVIDLMTEDAYAGFVRPPFVFTHRDAAQRDQFALSHSLKLLDYREALVERHRKMLNSEMLDSYVEGVDDRTIAEIYNLGDSDKWDRRSEEEKAKDEEWRKRAEALRKAGKMSADSFAPDAVPSQPGEDIHISEIGVTKDADGNITVVDVRAFKDESTVPEPVPQPEDSDDLRIDPGGPVAIFHKVSIARRKLFDITPVLASAGMDMGSLAVASRNSFDGCWVALRRQDVALDVEDALRQAGMDAALTTVNDLGEAILPRGVRVVEEAVAEVPARSWNGRQAEIDALDEAGRKAWLAGITGAEFLFAGDYHGPRHGCVVFIVPRSYFVVHNDLFPAALDIATLLPEDCREVAPGHYCSMTRDWMVLSHDLLKRGFTESLMLRLHLNNL